MRNPLVPLMILITVVTHAQDEKPTLKDVSADDFRLAETESRIGLGEMGQVSFKFGPKRETTVSGTYFERTDGTSTHTWIQTVEKKGRMFITDSIAASGIKIKLSAPGTQKPVFKAIAYRLEGKKIRKIKTTSLVSERNDTVYVQVQSGLLPKDIVEISYSAKTELDKTPIQYPINDLSPNSWSVIDFGTPSLLKYKFQFEGLYEDEMTKGQYSTPKSISVETFDSNNPDGSTKVALRKLSASYTELHDVFTFNARRTKQKLFTATLTEQNKVSFR